MTGLIDLDGTLTNTMGAWLTELNTLHAKDYKEEDIYNWDDITKWYPKKSCYEVLNSRGFYTDKVKPIPGASEFLKELKELGMDLKLVTANTESAEKKDYIANNFPSIFSEVVFIHDKSRIKGDFIFDDKFENVYHHIKSNDSLGLLYRHGGAYKYNDMIYRSPKYHRVNSYQDAISLIKSRLC